MTFEGIICPVCSGPLKEENFLGAIVCPHCNTKLKQKKYYSIFRIFNDARTSGRILIFLMNRYMDMKFKSPKLKKNYLMKLYMMNMKIKVKKWNLLMKSIN